MGAPIREPNPPRRYRVTSQCRRPADDTIYDLKLPRQLLEALRQKAHEDDLSIAQALRRLATRYVKGRVRA